MPDLSVETFSPHLNEQYTLLHDSGDELALELTEVKPLRGPVIDEAAPIAAQFRQEPFALLFRAEPGGVINQGLYDIRHQALETIQIFIVPVGSDARGEYYEAVFN